MKKTISILLALALLPLASCGIPADGESTVESSGRDDISAFVQAELDDNSASMEENGDSSSTDMPVSSETDPMLLRDMYTYSRGQNYNANDELISETEFFPDEQGRIGKSILHPFWNGGVESISEYIYSEEGFLETIVSDTGVTYTITENDMDHRKQVREDMDMEYINHYDEQGRLAKQEHFMSGMLNSSTTFTYEYDTEGRLLRTESHSPDGTLINYVLYEYD